MEINNKAFADRLKEIRNTLNETQKGFASKTGISRYALRYYELGTRTPDINFLIAVHNLTGYPLEYILGCTSNAHYETVYSDRDYGFTDASINKLRDNALYRDILNAIIQHEDFDDLMENISEYMLNMGAVRICKNSKKEYPKHKNDFDLMRTRLRENAEKFIKQIGQNLCDILGDEYVYIPFTKKLIDDGYPDEQKNSSFKKSAYGVFPPRSLVDLVDMLDTFKREGEES